MAALVGSAALLLLNPYPANAGRVPNQKEGQQISDALHSLGFTRWQGVELEGGSWQVSNAEGGKGNKVDLKLDSKTYKIVESKIK